MRAAEAAVAGLAPPFDFFDGFAFLDDRRDDDDDEAPRRRRVNAVVCVSVEGGCETNTTCVHLPRISFELYVCGWVPRLSINACFFAAALSGDAVDVAVAIA